MISREFEHDGGRLRVQIDRIDGERYQVCVGASEYEVAGRRLPDGRVRFELGGETFHAACAPAGTGEAATRRGDLHVTVGADSWMLTGTKGASRRRGGGATSADGVIVAPMTGTVLKVLVSEGDEVSAADTVAVISAMKMEHKLLAGIDGTVAEVAASEGATVDQDQVLLRVE